MAKVNPKYSTNGFRLAGTLDQDGLIWMPVSGSANITKGDVLYNDSGYVSQLSSLDSTFLGIAAADADNSSGSDGTIDVAVIPPRPHYRFWVKVENDAVVAATDVGAIFNIYSDDGIDSADTTCIYWGFRVEDIDVSTAAVAANTYGFVLGRFVNTADES